MQVAVLLVTNHGVFTRYTIFTIELASTCINQGHFPHTIDTLAQSFELKGMVRCANSSIILHVQSL